MFKNTGLIAVAALLAGCVAGQNIKLQYEPGTSQKAAVSSPFTLTVTDKREYVMSGRKTPSYIGHFRAGFGNTWDVTTYKKVPLADQMKSDLRQELLSLGFTEGAARSAKAVTVTILEWNFDAYINGRMWYEVQIAVATPDGRILADSSVKDEKTIEGNVMTGAKNAMARQVPVIYGEVIRKLIRENPKTLAALGG